MAVALFDTNILIDFLKGYKPAIDEIEYWDDAVISSITHRGQMGKARRLERGLFKATKAFQPRQSLSTSK
jgi:hypothetical protein